MKRKYVLATAAASVMAASLAHADTWKASVLYSLDLPAGFTSGAPFGTPQPAAEGQVVGYGSDGGNDTAILWTNAGTALNLAPTNISGITSSYAFGTNGTQQVGYGFGTGTSGNTHALLWNGAANTATDLNPTSLAGITSSYAYATNGTQQVGFGTGASGNSNALLWSGSAASAVNLNPTSISGITNSFANNTDGSQQVGYGYGTGTSNNAHAILWSGSASTAVDLNPTDISGITSSAANAVSGSQQVGYGLGSATGQNDQAMLWTGSASTAVNLNPTNISQITSSVADSTNGTQQVGYGFGDGTGDNAHALLWESTASSAIDLQLLLPAAGSWVYSNAYTVDASGNVFGVAYGLFRGVTTSYAIEWTPISPAVPSLTWNNTGAVSPSDGQNWDVNNNNNWVTGSASRVYVDGSNVIFNDNNNGNYSVTLNTTVSPASVNVGSTGNYTISGSGGISGSGSLTKSSTGTLTISTANSYTGGTLVSAGALLIEPTGNSNTSALPAGPLSISTGAFMQIGSNVTLGSQSVSPAAPTSNVNITSLSIAGTGTLDITNNHIIVDYTPGNDPIASIAALIKSGFNVGSTPWAGAGITSTAAAANSASYGIGYADAADTSNPAGLSSGQIEIMYTLLGDANLDGKVNGTDFAILAANFNQSVTSWDQGDFNYDGKANGSDFTALAANFNQGASQSADEAALAAFASANGLTASAVPEPASMGLLLAGFVGILGRRKRKH